MDPRDRRAAGNERAFRPTTAALNASQGPAGCRTRVHTRAHTCTWRVCWVELKDASMNTAEGGNGMLPVPRRFLHCGCRLEALASCRPIPSPWLLLALKHRGGRGCREAQTVQSHWDCGSNFIDSAPNAAPWWLHTRTVGFKEKTRIQEQSVKKTFDQSLTCSPEC